MPGIDLHRLRQEITMQQVLNLLGFEPTHRRGDQWYGRCPLHESPFDRGRSFSVNVAISRYRCHRCRQQGNALELWAACTQLPLYAAAIDLCHALGRPVPWLPR